jgi:hypothetical protein
VSASQSQLAGLTFEDSSSIRLFFAMPTDTSIELNHRRLPMASKAQIKEIVSMEVSQAVMKTLGALSGQPHDIEDGQLVVKQAKKAM